VAGVSVGTASVTGDMPLVAAEKFELLNASFNMGHRWMRSTRKASAV